MFSVFIATFNNISVISWPSDLLVEETESTLKKTTDMSSFIDKLYHIMLYRVHLAWMGFKFNVTDCIGSCKSNYHTITTTTTPESPLIIGVFLLSFWTSTIVAISNIFFISSLNKWQIFSSLSELWGWSWSGSYSSWICNYMCNQCLNTIKVMSSSNLAHGEVYSIQHYVIQFCGFLLVGTLVSSTNTTDRNDITEILLKVALNTMTSPLL